MNGFRFSMLVRVFLLLLIVSCARQQPPVEEPLPEATPSVEETQLVVEPQLMEEQCINFLGFPDNAIFGQWFELEGVRFAALGNRDLFVNDVTTDVHGLAFDEDGIQINLPGPTSVVTLTTGAWFPEQLEITTLDSNGNVVDQITDPADNSLHIYSLSGDEIATVVITGGGGEGVLVEICIEVEPEPIVEEQCINFLGFPDNATFDQWFELEGVGFTALGNRDLFVNDVTTDVHGLVFDEDGIQIDLPGPTSVVILTTGAWFPEQLEITTLDSNGNVVNQITDPADNSLHNYGLSGDEIATVVITGGGGEGVLVEICIALG